MAFDLPTMLGILRSLALYYGRPDRTRALMRFYRPLVPEGGLAFDVGAHVGNRTRVLRRLGLRVVALEPQPAFASFLERTLPRDGVELVREAVGAQEGEAVMRISRRHPTVSSLSEEWIGTVGPTDGFTQVRWDREHRVPVTTLDRLIDRFGQPDFCKIDVEGLEPDILAGLSRPLPLVAFEYLPAALPLAERCVDRLGTLGRYVYNLAEGEDHRFLAPTWLEASELKALMRETARNGRSGDIYARLEQPG